MQLSFAYKMERQFPPTQTKKRLLQQQQNNSYIRIESSEEAKKQTEMYTTNWIELDYFVRLFNHHSRRDR